MITNFDLESINGQPIPDHSSNTYNCNVCRIIIIIGVNCFFFQNTHLKDECWVKRLKRHGWMLASAPMKMMIARVYTHARKSVKGDLVTYVRIMYTHQLTVRLCVQEIDSAPRY